MRAAIPLLGRARIAGLLLLFSTACTTTDGSGTAGPRRNDSGGPLLAEQAAYDVRYYELSVAVDPEQRSVEGRLVVRADVLEPLERFVLDLDSRLAVRRVSEQGRDRTFTHDGGRIRVELGEERPRGARLELEVEYGGIPREAPRPPWEGGFTWSSTADGSPWIATSNQGEGADLWWPCKDHPSDEPDSMHIRVRVPAPLVCASNGRLERVEEHANGTRTFHWFVSTPINNYTVALNIAPYATIRRDFASVSGDLIPVTYWVLPENIRKGEELMEQILEHLRFFEDLLGPYPFRADKYGVAETPHLGMEHQTIIAYGNGYRNNRWGYDWLHHHELAHEWFANLVTAPDWNDFWIHEGFGTYLQNLYVEKLHGKAAYRESLEELRGRILNLRPVAPREARSSGQMYFLDDGETEGRRSSDGDIYYKGAWILHSLRWLIGDADFFRLLRRMAYPDEGWEARTDGSQCRFATTEDFRVLAEELTGRELGWFVELYLRQPELPVLESELRGSQLELRWRTPAGLSFPMPVEVRIGEERRRIPMPGGRALVEIPPGVDHELDPDRWLLRAPSSPTR